MDRLTFAPRTAEFFLWNEQGAPPASDLGERLAHAGWPAQVRLIGGPWHLHLLQGTLVELIDAVPLLSCASGAEGTMGVYCAAARLGLELVLHRRLTPHLVPRHPPGDPRVIGWEARWRLLHEERGHLRALAERLDPVEMALPPRAPPPEHGPTAAGLLHELLDACADVLVREAAWRGAVVRLRDVAAAAWEQRLIHALCDEHAGFAPDPGEGGEALVHELNAWAQDRCLDAPLLSAPPSWRPAEPLEHALSRLIEPAVHLARRLLLDHAAPRTLAEAP
jgi:hypothetical protein